MFKSNKSYCVGANAAQAVGSVSVKSVTEFSMCLHRSTADRPVGVCLLPSVQKVQLHIKLHFAYLRAAVPF